MGNSMRMGSALTRREALAAMLAGAALAGLGACGTRALAADVREAARSALDAQAASSQVDASTRAHGVPADFTDDLGRAVHVESVERVVACMGSFARVWQLAGGSLVGVSSDALADYPELDLPADIAQVGDFSSPSVEQIVALDPTLVIMSGASGGRGGSGSQADYADALADAGVTCAFFKVTTFDDYLRMLRTCCDLTGRDDLYVQAGEDVRTRIQSVLEAADAARAGASPTVAVLTTYSGGTRVQNSQTQTGSMLAELGASNIADANPSLLKDYSVEALLAADPDFVFVLPMGTDAEAAERALAEQTSDDPAWASLTAVARNRCFTLDPRLFQYKPLDRWDEAYRELARDLYGIDAE